MGQVIDFPGAKAYDMLSDSMQMLTPAEVRRQHRIRQIRELLDRIEAMAGLRRPTDPAA